MKTHILWTGLVLVGLLALSGDDPARGCAVAPARDQTVQIADESAIILWDAATKTEHFIRRASFQTKAKDFGFLVPTPTKPTLAESSDEAFKTLAKLTEPEVVTKPKPASGPGCGCAASAPPTAGTAEPVRVLDEARVGGYDAVVLEADDAKALSDWLTKNGYDFSAELTGWADHYIKLKWKITAFKVARDKDKAETPGIATSAVRMTFQTEQPFFPYREPEAKEKEAAAKAAPQDRLLRVFFIGEKRMDGKLEGAAEAWPGHSIWSNKLTEENRKHLLEQLKLPADTAPATWWLTEFEDNSSPRPGKADVVFSPAEKQDPIAPPPIIRYVSGSLPNCVMCYALAAYMLVPFLLRRARR
jgi:hypothetical protein